MKKVFLSIAMMMSVAIAFGQALSKDEIKAQKKQIKQLSNIVKAAENMIINDPNGALNTISSAVKNDLMQNNAEMWFVVSKAKRGAIDLENNKKVKNEAYDVNKLNTYAYEIFDDVNNCYTLDNTPNAKGKIAAKYTEDLTPIIAGCHYHLYNAGGDYFKNGDYAQASKYFARLADVADYGFMKDLVNNSQDSLIIATAAYNATVCAMQDKNYEMVLKYIERFENDPERTELYYDHKIRALKAVGDTLAWVETLKKAIKVFPTNEMFQNNLIQYFNEKNMYNELFAFMDEMIATDPFNSYFYFVKGVIYNKYDSLDSAIDCYSKAIEVNPNHMESLGNIARCYIKKAQDYSNNQASTNLRNKAQLKKDKEIIQGYYRNALPHFEKLRQLAPDNKDLWLSGLGNCYYNLNMEKEFKSIESLFEE